ncbi:MAG: peptide chain release factor 2 [Candidatus Eisenbacteria bacterium]|nr:peptide chain release factor 2 [Candidatus Eisenbacteria bacterium]
MSSEHTRRNEELLRRLKELEDHLDVADKERRRAELEALTAEPDFWNDQERAKTVLDELNAVKAWLEPLAEVAGRLEDAAALAEMAEEEGGEAEEAARAETEKVEKLLSELEFRKMLSGPNDSRNAILAIHPGAGGTESADWAGMLLRMYTAWCDGRGYESSVIDLQPGDEAGIKSATLLVKGPYAYGYLRAESGVHRLVRISPFDAAHRRHTSFASVAAYPEVEDDVEIEISDADIKLDFFRASGPGGQHVNKSSTAVRITHEPTGIVVSSQAERSQFRNRENAMKVLRSRLYALKEEEQRKEQEKAAGEKQEIAWGSQIRSYVLHPYQLVKDTRTGAETSDVDGVLDGDIDAFIEAYLKATG